MIDYLFSMLLVSVLPALEDPRVNHAQALAELERRLHEGHLQTSPVAAPSEAKSGVDGLKVTSPELPVITGRLFEWSNSKWSDEADRRAAIGLSAESLRLTGLIESSGHRVAILNDGQVDHVVGVGSYVLDTYRVTSLGRGQIVLAPLDARAGGKNLELNLMPVLAPGGL